MYERADPADDQIRALLRQGFEESTTGPVAEAEAATGLSDLWRRVAERSWEASSPTHPDGTPPIE